MEKNITASFRNIEALKQAEEDLRRQGSTIDIRVATPDFELTHVQGRNPSYSLDVYVEPSRSQLALDTIERYGGIAFNISQE